jgi:hypothetical protein
VEVQGVVIPVAVEVIVVLGRKVGVTQILNEDDQGRRRDEDGIHRRIEVVRQRERQFPVGNPLPEEILQHRGEIRREEGEGILIRREEMQEVNRHLGGGILQMNHLLGVLSMNRREGDAIHHRVEAPLHQRDDSIAMAPLAAIGLLHVVIVRLIAHLIRVRLAEGMCLPEDEIIGHPLVADPLRLDVAIRLGYRDGTVLPLAGRQIIRIQRIAGVEVQVSIVEIRIEADGPRWMQFRK